MMTAITSNENSAPKKIYLKDYKAPSFGIDSVELFFELSRSKTLVRSKLELTKIGTDPDLFLDGVGFKTLSLKINSKPLQESDYTKTSQGLWLLNVPSSFVFESLVELCPQENTSLEGLYVSGPYLTTQCEAQGFRKITYFMDRPDIMTSFKVHLIADKTLFPVLLSNGDLISSKDLSNNQHQTTWQDPHKKPCYLFALVAGDLGFITDHFTTQSGKNVKLCVYSPHGTQDRCHYAMESLKKSMKWDEERFGREYDLSTYMIVAMDDFNAGAMENKGLNIFNSRLVLANPKTATDGNYFAIESVVAHEYFHNWTGNRVTLRDWFHLSLKEGLTVFRDQEFSMDLHSRAMVRIDTVADLRDGQFAEDMGPNAHPIRPESCYAVDNFFTSTIYEKGSEVIRMMQTMVGRPGFRKGMDLYFERFDGKAVIIEDFAGAISDANNQDWTQFKRWYSQAGTPIVKVLEKYDSVQKTYEINFTQSCPTTAGQSQALEFHIPLVLGLIGADGKELVIKDHPEIQMNTESECIFHFKTKNHTLKFSNMTQKPVLSINRGFSAPVHLMSEVSDSDLVFLLKNDTDAFNRWESCQKLMRKDLLSLVSLAQKSEALRPNPVLQQALLEALWDTSLDSNLKSKLLELPSDSYLSQLVDTFDPEAFQNARKCWKLSFAKIAESTLLDIYKKYHGKNDTSLHHSHMAERRLKNSALGFLALLSNHESLALAQFSKAAHMTDEAASFEVILNALPQHATETIKTFHSRWKNETLVLNTWFAIQASSDSSETSARIKALWEHDDFNPKNPNRVYSLLRRFGDNLACFHEKSGANYPWLAQKIHELDEINPQVATRIAGAFDLCTKVSAPAKNTAQACLEKILNAGLSKNTYEVVSKILEELKK